MTRFRLSIWYKLSDEETPQVETVDEYQVEQALGAFGRDMTYLKGEGVRKMMVEVVDG